MLGENAPSYRASSAARDPRASESSSTFVCIAKCDSGGLFSILNVDNNTGHRLSNQPSLLTRSWHVYARNWRVSRSWPGVRARASVDDRKRGAQRGGSVANHQFHRRSRSSRIPVTDEPMPSHRRCHRICVRSSTAADSMSIALRREGLPDRTSALLNTNTKRERVSDDRRRRTGRGDLRKW